MGVSYELIAYRGDEDDKPIVITKRSAQRECKTLSEQTPLPVTASLPTYQANLTWLFHHVDANLAATFKIDKKKDSCYTPRRNEHVEAALDAFGALLPLVSGLSDFLSSTLLNSWHTSICKDVAVADPISEARVFIPVLPILERTGKKPSKHHKSPRPKSLDDDGNVCCDLSLGFR